MLSYLKRVGKKSAIYGLGDFLVRAAGFFLIPIYTRFLNPADYGILSSALVISSILAIVYRLGLDGASGRFYFDFEGEERKRYFGTIFIFLVFFTLGLTLILHKNGDFLSKIFRNIPYDPYLKLVLWITFFSTFSAIPLVLYRMREEAHRYIFFQVSNFIVLTISIIYFVTYLKEGAIGSLKGRFLCFLLFFFIYIILTLKEIKFSFSGSKLINSLKFGVPIVPHLFFHWVLDLSDRILLERLSNLRNVGLYSLGYRLGGVMNYVIGAINKAWVPFFYDTDKQKGEEAKYIFSNMITYCLVFIIFAGVCLSIFSKEILVIFATPKYYESFKIIPLIVLACIFRGMYNFSVNVIFLKKKTSSLPLITGISAGVNLGLNIIMIPKLGILGAAYSTVLGYLTLFLLTYFFAKKYYSIPHQWQRLAKAGLSAGAIYFLATYFFKDFAILKLLLLLSYPVILYSLGFFTAEEKSGISRLILRG